MMADVMTRILGGNRVQIVQSTSARLSERADPVHVGTQDMTLEHTDPLNPANLCSSVVPP
jgi:hypothetical protein